MSTRKSLLGLSCIVAQSPLGPLRMPFVCKFFRRILVLGEAEVFFNFQVVTVCVCRLRYRLALGVCTLLKNETVFSFCALPFRFFAFACGFVAWDCSCLLFLLPHKVGGGPHWAGGYPECPPSLSCRVLAARTCALRSYTPCTCGVCMGQGLRVLPWGRCGLQLPALKKRNPSGIVCPHLKV